MDITFIPGEVTPEKVTVPPEEPVAASDDAQSRRRGTERDERVASLDAIAERRELCRKPPFLKAKRGRMF